jgi:CheY-like chemotaxis protein
MTEAHDAECGWQLLDAKNYNIMLMDLRMPGMDGLTAIEHIRARGDAKGLLPIIVVAGDSSAGLLERCLAKGADEVILKPIAMARLLKSMTTILAKAR